MLVDGTRIGFTGEGSIRRREVVYGSIVREEAWYAVTYDQLTKLAYAKEVRVKVTGSTKYKGRFRIQHG